jgi:hypothetical protein
MESPQRTWSHLQFAKRIWKQFNVTLTYADDSDVTYSRFTTLQCKKRSPMAAASRNFARGKTKNATALWIVSNCNETSGRELYVEELKKHLPVDVYGACGQPLPCERYRKDSNRRGGCVRRLMAEYKFYLSFENSFCDGYLTEKIWKTTRVNVIPVVMGSVDYDAVLTPGTYIDVRDFGSPRDLADYLHYLDANDEMYSAIIRKRRSVDCLRLTPGTPHCMLCHHLHLYRGRTQMVADIADFWSPSRRCADPDEFFRGIADNVIADNPHLRAKYE